MEGIISQIINKDSFGQLVSQQVGKQIDTAEIEQELDIATKAQRQALGLQRKLESELDRLDVTDKHYDRKYESLNRRLDEAFDAVINDIAFKGKRSIQWEDVEEYLKRYVGDIYSIAEDNEIIYIGPELPSEYAGSVYTKKLKGTAAKAKANAAQAIPEMIEIASNGIFEENRKPKHGRDAKNGWYRYDTRFALPVYGDDGNVERYNIFRGRILIRYASSGKKYLYDILEIKKETGKSCQT